MYKITCSINLENAEKCYGAVWWMFSQNGPQLGFFSVGQKGKKQKHWIIDRPIMSGEYCKSTKFRARFNFANFAIFANSQN